MKLKCYISNCVLYDKNISLEIEEYNISLIQLDEINFSDKVKYKAKNIESSYFIVENVNKQDIDKVMEIIFNLCSLLSFATQSAVRFLRSEIEYIIQYENYSIGLYNYSVPPIELMDNSVKFFLESIYKKYKELKKQRKLNVAIEYLVSLETIKMPCELKLATIFILLENLKTTYAECCGYYFDKYWYRDKSKKEKINFKPMLNDMFETVLIKKNLKKIVDLRNEIIHSGLSQLSYEKQYIIYEECQDLIQLYILKLLNYEGYYFPYSTRGTQNIKLEN